jgi:hypothetical protein
LILDHFGRNRTVYTVEATVTAGKICVASKNMHSVYEECDGLKPNFDDT